MYIKYVIVIQTSSSILLVKESSPNFRTIVKNIATRQARNHVCRTALVSIKTGLSEVVGVEAPLGFGELVDPGVRWGPLIHKNASAMAIFRNLN